MLFCVSFHARASFGGGIVCCEGAVGHAEASGFARDTGCDTREGTRRSDILNPQTGGRPDTTAIPMRRNSAETRVRLTLKPITPSTRKSIENLALGMSRKNAEERGKWAIAAWHAGGQRFDPARVHHSFGRRGWRRKNPRKSQAFADRTKRWDRALGRLLAFDCGLISARVLLTTSFG